MQREPALRSLVAKGAFVLFLFWVGASLAQTNAEPKILFLQLKVKGGAVSLVKSATRPGILKRTRTPAADELQFELLSETGESLWRAGVPDPTVRRVEYEDPPGSGNLKSKVIQLEEAEVTVRVPVVPKGHHVEFYRLEAPTPGAKGEKTFAHRSFGTVRLP